MISFIATGDSFINRRLPEHDEPARQLAQLIGNADVRFTNLETVLRRDEGFPAAQSGGTWASSPPEVLDDLRHYGFNVLAWANNHTLDYSHGGLEATQKYLDQSGLVHAGAGRNLAEASAVRYLECSGGRVALIAATSTFHESWPAGEQRPDMPGRPGVHPLHFETVYRVNAAQWHHLQQIARATGINARRDLQVKEGFAIADPKSTFRFGSHLFELDENGETGEVTRPKRRDMERFRALISQAKRSADIVLISIHSHEMKGDNKELPADFLVKFSRQCIDNGAHAVLGHGPHILRGIELYRGCPIFYSLGDFIFQNDTVSRLPADFYEKYGLSHDHNVTDALETRSDGDQRGLGTNPDVWRSVVARWEIDNGKLTKIELHPISLGFGEPSYRRGWPRLSQDNSTLHHLQNLSKPFGTTIAIENGIGKVLLDETSSGE